MSAIVYCDLIQRAGEGCYYLWGPIQNALLMELNSSNPDLLVDICTKGDLTSYNRMPAIQKDMLVHVLTIAGQDNMRQVEQLLWRILRTRPKRGASASRRKLTEAKKVVTEVAGELALEDVLIELLQDRDEDVRRTAVRSTFHLGKTNPGAVISILKKLGDPESIHTWLLPSRRRLQSCFELSLSVLFDSYADSRTTADLYKIWSDILGRFVKKPSDCEDSPSTSEGSNDGRLRKPLLRLGLWFVESMAKNLEEERMSVYSLQEMAAFFESSDSGKLKQSFSILVDFLDPAFGSLEEPHIMEALKIVVTSRDVLSGYLLVCILAARIMVQPQETLRVVEVLFETAIAFDGTEAERAGLPSIPMLIIALSSACDRDLTVRDSDADLNPDLVRLEPEVLKLERRMIWEYQKKHGSKCQAREGTRFIYSGLSSYPQYPWRINREIDQDLLQRAFIGPARKMHTGEYEYEKIRNYVVNVAVPGHPRYRAHRPILECLNPVRDLAFFEVKEEDVNRAQARFTRYAPSRVDRLMSRILARFGKHRPTQVERFMEQDSLPTEMKEMVVFQDLLVDAFARIAVYAEEEVEVFMDEAHLPNGFQDRVRNKRSEEELAAAVIGHGVFFVRDAVLLRPDSPLARIFVRWFELAPKSKSLADWLNSGLTLVLDAMCAGRLPE